MTFSLRPYLIAVVAATTVAAALRGADTPPEVSEAPAQSFSLHTQATWIDQGHPSFPSAYEGPNSLTSASQFERTFSFSVFAGISLPGAVQLYYDPEAFQGHGLANTLGMAGFPNGEAVKAAFPTFHYNTSRLYLQKSIGLGGETQDVADGMNQVPMKQQAEHLTFSVGKFAASDFFDGNSYSHDTRSQFLNWSLWESGAWDYPADVVGYTAGFVAEWYRKDFVVHYGIFMMPTASNGPTLDSRIREANGQILQVDLPYTSGGNTGTLRPFVYWNHARMGSYQDAVESASGDLLATRAYRSKEGFGVSWDQSLGSDWGLFARLSWDDGRTESFVFTEIDRSLALGASASGARWGRKADTLGIAGVVNLLSDDHKAYLASGGTEGLILGDGGLNYGPEEILETYYSVQATSWLSLSPDFQYAWHPGYNRARGPVPIYSLRAHVFF